MPLKNFFNRKNLAKTSCFYPLNKKNDYQKEMLDNHFLYYTKSKSTF